MNKLVKLSTTPTTGGWHVLRGDKPLHTPRGVNLLLPTEALAEAIASEWRVLKGQPKLGEIPLTQFANTAADHTATDRANAIEAFLSHAETDLLCYRAAHPAALVAKQAEGWGAVLEWLQQTHGAELMVYTGITPQPQPASTLAKLRAVAEGLDDFRLTALSFGAGLLGSAVLSLALLQGRLTTEETLKLTLLDEAFQAEQWGELPEQTQRRESMAAEIKSLAGFISLLA